jgi:hypothetical protein
LFFIKVGCKKSFFTADFPNHRLRCKSFQKLPTDRFGLKFGEEPESPTAKRTKHQEQKDGVWKYFDNKGNVVQV